MYLSMSPHYISPVLSPNTRPSKLVWFGDKLLFLSVQYTVCTIENKPIHSLYCTLYTVHYILYTIYCTLYAVQYILYTICCTVYAVKYMMYSIYCTVYTVHYILYSIYCTLYTVHYMMCTSDCTINPPAPRKVRDPASLYFTKKKGTL